MRGAGWGWVVMDAHSWPFWLKGPCSCVCASQLCARPLVPGGDFEDLFLLLKSYELVYEPITVTVLLFEHCRLPTAGRSEAPGLPLLSRRLDRV